ncbi:hypothetical protein ACQCVK_16180 [Rossellomorea vietnamensis]|uniref:Uncharacterized protein n=1 Tax=Rossellomorea aquimaris TaxID=189382 RepID=A0A5D4TE92_9BACI|nr:hypothetical protein [Rossellomorea aquimaris]TYS74073.1 hypothetical protein FZC80_18775 [Rossellomorea aquimaris]
MDALGISVAVLMIVIVVFSSKKEYNKMSTAEKEKLKEELRNPLILIAGLIPAGFLLVFISIALQSATLRYIAFALMGLGMIIEGAMLSKESSRGTLLVVLGSSAILVLGLLATRPFW